METVETNSDRTLEKRGLKILIILLLLFIIYYSAMVFLSPGKKLKEMNKEFAFKQDVKIKVDNRIFSDSAYLKLYREKAFLKARVSMSESDSVYLTVNLPDSTINLEISGVVVHPAKVRSIKMSKILEKGSDYINSTMFSSPLTIASDISSIEKEPLIIKMAPKDTSEYRPDIIPDTATFEPVNYMLEMTNGIRLYFYQEEESRPGDRSHFLKFDLTDRLRNTFSSLKSVIHFKIPEYHPYIKLTLPRADAKSIYRAIPVHGQVGVYLKE
jgi:hypothetical protein